MLRPKNELVHLAFYGGVETSSIEMLNVFCESSENSLENLSRLVREIGSLGLICSPALTKGNFEDKRVLRAANTPKIDVDQLKLRFEGDEDHTLELKSSLMYNFNQAEAQLRVIPEQLNHEIPIHSVLKTICAFLNSNGGELFIGVEDKGNLVGVEIDFSCVPKISNCDSWLNFLKSLIKTNFHFGQTVLMYLDFELIDIDEVTICKVAVARSEKIQFIKEKRKSKVFKCYYRVNNGTEEISIQELPEYIISRT